jgi:hypothetical protein
MGFSAIKVKCSADCQMTDGWPAAVGEFVHTWLVGTFVVTWIVLYFNKLRNYRSAKDFRRSRSVMIGYSLQSNKIQTLYISPKILYDTTCFGLRPSSDIPNTKRLT